MLPLLPAMETKKEEEKEKLRGKKGNTKNSNLKMILDCCLSFSTLSFFAPPPITFPSPSSFPFSSPFRPLALPNPTPSFYLFAVLHFFPHATTMRVFSNHYFIPPIPESQLHHTAARVSAPFPFFALCIHLFLYSVLCCPPFPVVQTLSLSLYTVSPIPPPCHTLYSVSSSSHNQSYNQAAASSSSSNVFVGVAVCHCC